MKRSASGAIATLVRWRGFQESSASIVYGQTTRVVEHSSSSLEQARARLEEVQSYRLGLLQVPRLDMSRLQVSADIEGAAHQHAKERELELEAAKERQEEARAAHVQARARTRVAESRHARMAASEAERNEKRLSDWMADLCTATRTQR